MNTQKISEVSGKVLDDTMGVVKSHPGIAALLGFGITWLMADTMFKRDGTAGSKIVTQFQEEIPQVMEKAEQIAEETGDVIARKKSQTVFQKISCFMDEKPLTVGVLGISTGLIFGVMTSGILKGRTDFWTETGRAVTEKGRAVMSKTRQVISDSRERAGHVIDAAREEAERQNLIPH
jgi:ElaB/YqjD/DUF883 family membrane-anchored ribosome-binding protein